MDLHFESVNPNNIKQVENLRVNPSQTSYIETVHECILDSKKDKGWKTVGIYDNKTLVGFAMYGYVDGTSSKEAWLDRLLIDKKFQSKGYGKRAILKLLKIMKKEYNTDKVYLSVYDSNKVAIKIYQKLGFKFNGKYDINGEKIMAYEF